MMRQRKVLVPIQAPRSRRKRIPKQTKDVQRAIMDVILNEIEAEKENRFNEASGSLSEREASYGLMDAV